MKRVISFALFLICLVCFSSCATRLVSVPEYMRFTDDTGEEVILFSRPVRVAVLMSSLAEVWNLSGGSIDVTVGESVERGFAPSDVILVDGGAGKVINHELLIDSKADFVICSADIPAQREAAEMMKESGIPGACFRIESFEDYLRVLSVFCRINGNADAYEKYGTELLAEVMLTREMAKDNGKTALFLRAGSSSSSVKAKQSDDHFAAHMLTELGVTNIADEAPALIDSLSVEEILLENPEYIFIATMGNEEAAKKNVEEMFSRPEWQGVSAVRDKRYVFLPKELFHYKPNARWGEAYKFLVDFIYDYE